MDAEQQEERAALDAYYRGPVDTAREQRMTEVVERLGGRLSFHEQATLPPEVSNSVCITYEFSDLAIAEKAAEALRKMGEHVEGPYPY